MVFICYNNILCYITYVCISLRDNTRSRLYRRNTFIAQFMLTVYFFCCFHNHYILYTLITTLHITHILLPHTLTHTHTGRHTHTYIHNTTMGDAVFYGGRAVSAFRRWQRTRLDTHTQIEDTARQREPMYITCA